MLELDIGGSQGVIYGETYFANDREVYKQSYNMPIFVLDTFIQNGGEIFFRASDEFRLFNVSLLIQKLWSPIR